MNVSQKKLVYDAFNWTIHHNFIEKLQHYPISIGFITKSDTFGSMKKIASGNLSKPDRNFDWIKFVILSAWYWIF